MSPALQIVLMSKWTEKELSRSATPGEDSDDKNSPHISSGGATRDNISSIAAQPTVRDASSDQSSDHESLHSAGNSELESNATEESTGSSDSDYAPEDGPQPGNAGTGS